MIDPGKTYSLPEAIDLAKKFPTPKFDPTVTVSFNLGVDPRKSDQMVRGSVILPNGTGKEVKVAVFAKGEAAKAAEEAGAQYVGFEDLIKKVQEGFTDFDAAIATPEAMAEVRKIARILGPRGLMPNPKTGTVTDDTAKAVKEVKAGRVEYKVDKTANLHVPVGRRSFSKEHLVENARTVMDTVVKARPASVRGTFIKNCVMAATMIPSVRLDPNEYQKA